MGDSFDESTLELAHWSLRSRMFRELRPYDDGGPRPIPVMTMVPARRRDEWPAIRGLWLGMPPHPNVLDAVDVTPHAALVRYAAIRWRHPGLVNSAPDATRRRLATWGIQLVDGFRTISAGVPRDVLGRITNPHVEVDLERQLRIGFLPVLAEDETTTGHVPPEVRTGWPSGQERSLVYVIGSVLRQLWLGTPRRDEYEVSATISCAVEEDPANRFTLDELESAFVALGGHAGTVRRGDRWVAWMKAEAGIGMLALLRADAAIEYLEEACALDDNCLLARWARERAHALVAADHARWVTAQTSRKVVVSLDLEWSNVVAIGQREEAHGAYRKALELYQRVLPDTAPAAALLLARARCHLALGDTGPAVDYARRAHAEDPSREAFVIEIRALLQRGDHRDALARIDSGEYPLTDADLQYFRGRSLLGLGRVIEARDAFEYALRLKPTMLAAMFMRRDIERLMRATRAAAGPSDATAPPAIPAHLQGVHSMLIADRTAEALEELARDGYARDPIAQLTRGDLLLAEQRGAEALDVYLRASQLGADTRPAAVVGTGLALLALGRAEEALEMFGHVPDSPEALEGRARALDALGRGDEAEAARKRHAEAAAARSDLRLRAR